ncbi:MAG: nucleoside-diphosphate-sugar epimerase [Candidatus Omnitrophota bacterium]|jgi:nucleoside-diphosphate-sugar epimerase
MTDKKRKINIMAKKKKVERILVTGGAGFIGSNIVEELVKRKNIKVRIIDDFSAGKMSHIKDFKDEIEIIRGDIRNAKTVRKAMLGVTRVIHQAAIRSVPKSVDNPFLSHEVNTTGTLILLNEAVRAKVKRFVYASSSSAYGDTAKFPQKETDLLKPLSPYGVSKLCAEHYCHSFHAVHGLETVALRYFNVYGPRQNPESKYSAVVPIFIYNLKKGVAPKIDGSGKQSRDFTYVKDVANANIKAAFASSKVAGKSFNIAGGGDCSVIGILHYIEKYLGIKIKPEFGPRRRGDAMRTYADISQPKKIMGWQPKMKLAEGLKRTVEWFEKNDPTLL